MPTRRSKSFFHEAVRPDDEAARQREVEALLAPRRLLVQDVPAERIQPNPFQARKSFEGLEELRDAILTLGFTSRLRVRPNPTIPNFFQLVYGERRLRAARMAGIDLIPCEIAEHSDDELLEIGLAENIQRQDLNPLEEAQAFVTFIRERGYSVRRLAERIGKEKGYIENRINLLKVPDDVQAMVAQRADTLVAAREIARIDVPEQRAPLIAQMLDGSLSTSGLRDVIRDLTGVTPRTAPSDTPTTGAHPAESIRMSRGTPPDTTQVEPHIPTIHATDRLIRREAATVRTILERWEQLSTTTGTVSPVLASVTKEVLEQAQRVAQILHIEHTQRS